LQPAGQRSQILDDHPAARSPAVTKPVPLMPSVARVVEPSEAFPETPFTSATVIG
jgi:hypothetical protein